MKPPVPSKLVTAVIFFIALVLVPAPHAHSEKANPKMMLAQAVICEAMENFQPVNPAVVFSISHGQVFCFSNFDPVFEKTYVFHKWYKRDKLIFTMRLTLSPPKWSSFSTIQIREADKGPWRVEIRDVDDALLQTLRFSMVD